MKTKNELEQVLAMQAIDLAKQREVIADQKKTIAELESQIFALKQFPPTEDSAATVHAEEVRQLNLRIEYSERMAHQYYKRDQEHIETAKLLRSRFAHCEARLWALGKAVRGAIEAMEESKGDLMGDANDGFLNADVAALIDDQVEFLGGVIAALRKASNEASERSSHA